MTTQTDSITYRVRVDDTHIKLDATTMPDAVIEARTMCAYSDYSGGANDLAGTYWADLVIRGSDGSREDIEVQLDPPEPKCTHAEHEWVDGPARGHGGGVICTDSCKYCYWTRITNTWATRSDNGRQGYHTMTYRRIRAERYPE